MFEELDLTIDEPGTESDLVMTTGNFTHAFFSCTTNTCSEGKYCC